MFFLIYGVSSLSARAGESPWQWAMTLQETADPLNVMNSATALYIDKDVARYYVVDAGKNRLLSYNREGKFLSEFSARNNLMTPYDMIREPGILWIVEKGRNSVTKIDLQKKKIVPHTISDQGSTVYPDRLEIDRNTLYLLNKAKGNILALDNNLKVLHRYNCDDCDAGFVDFKIKDNRIWALEQKEKAVYVFSMDGKQEEKIQLQPEKIDFARSLAVGENDLLYILDRHKASIAIFGMNGEFKYSFLKEGQARGQLYYPIEIKFDPWGRLCVVEEGNGRVQIFLHK
jgi:sugar lactone lactonase YvrE